MTADPTPRLGAEPLSNGGARFLVWAPRADRVDLRIIGDPERVIAMEPRERGYFTVIVRDVVSGTRYRYRLNGAVELPDPAARLQPEGVSGPSEVVTDQFDWTDAGWVRSAANRYVMREINVGSFTREGTFAAIIPRLPELKASGINAIELMPINEFGGRRNSPSDSLFPVSVHSDYGGPAGLKELVNACHREGIAVALDLLFTARDLGNYLLGFGPYFSDQHVTQWGRTLNFDGPEGAEVRRLFIESAVRFVEEFHIDAIRLDGVHAIIDYSVPSFVQEIGEAVQARGAGFLPAHPAPSPPSR
ncbi:MAG: hypothetical protein HY534_04335 [Chloroflexi bacterium]|nr:hypothetical protein [Chloroflexota bacterium]